MKIQCPCGAKFDFDVTPEMAENPVQFVCPNCGLDSSDYVNELIRRGFAGEAPAAAPPAVATTVKTQPLRIALAQPPAGQTGDAAAAAADTPQFCPKHNSPATHRCLVCQKPICPKCMELFGYVCSPFCKARAEALKMEIPVYEGQRTVIAAKFSKKAGRISTVAGVVGAALLGFWFWYAWFGSVPHPAFSVRFADRAYSGEVRLCGTNQIVFLHGGTLARCDIKSQKEIWSQELITRQQIADEAARMSKLGGRSGSPPAQDKLTRWVEKELTSGLHLHVSGRNLWVSAPGKITHYAWDTGRVLQEIPLTAGVGEFISQGGELLMPQESETGEPSVTRINLANGEVRTETIGATGKIAVASRQNTPGTMAMASAGGAGGPATAGLPVGAPGADMGKPMEPAKVAAQAQNLPLPARIALPAVLANSMHQERIQAELAEEPTPGQPQAASTPRPATAKTQPAEPFSLIPSEYGYVQFAVRLLESRIVTREAMKAPPKKSALAGDLNVTKTTDAANEILNEMQRSRGGSTVEEDESRYQVTLRRPDSTATSDWTGEVIGPPRLFPLKTVNVLAAGKTLVVFDKTNKKLWQSALTYPVTGGAGAMGRGRVAAGRGAMRRARRHAFCFRPGGADGV